MKESKKEEIKENELADASPDSSFSSRLEDKEASNNATGSQPSNFSGLEEKEESSTYVDPAVRE